MSGWPPAPLTRLTPSRGRWCGIRATEYIRYARSHGKKIAVLCGRPYHIDPEINHGIDRLLTSLGMVVISEDCISDLVEPVKVDVLNQWTYHARLYNAAKYVTQHADMELIQLVSFGCGIDAITTDEVRSILESAGKLYTQLKIDEISNLGAVRIRLRSLSGRLPNGKRSTPPAGWQTPDPAAAANRRNNPCRKVIHIEGKVYGTSRFYQRNEKDPHHPGARQCCPSIST